MSKKFAVFALVLILLWVSFFPAPLQLKYHLFTNTALSLFFVLLVILKRGKVFKKADFALWIFAISMGVNVIFAQDKNTALRTYLDLILPLVTVYYLAQESVSSKVSFRFIAATWCFLSGAVALIGIGEVLFRANPLYQHFIENQYYARYIGSSLARPMSTQFNPAVLGSYLLVSLPFNFLFIKHRSFFVRLLVTSGIVLTVAVIILTFSRGAFLGLLAVTLFYLLAKKKYRSVRLLVIILAVFIILCSFLPYPFSKFNIKSFVGEWGIFSSYNLNRHTMTKRIFIDHPFTGLGFQHFRSRFYEYYPGLGKVPYENMIADNMYLTILTETGIIGFGAFWVFIFTLLRKGFYYLKNEFRKDERKALFIVISGFLGLLVTTAGYELFYWPSPFFLFCILSGMLKGLSERESEPPALKAS
ncbi:MAG: O-antigen ligase family protein [Candidatus Omnitrophota bacterium]|nr:O-antigen ligase family protein [Candidatus Omnitrophota bacterium]